MKLNQILKFVGIIIGTISALTLISQHPINILILGIGVAIYFAGNSLKKKGK